MEEEKQEVLVEEKPAEAAPAVKDDPELRKKSLLGFIFALVGLAHNAHELALRNGEGDAAQGMHIFATHAEDALQLFYSQYVFCHNYRSLFCGGPILNGLELPSP